MSKGRSVKLQAIANRMDGKAGKMLRSVIRDYRWIHIGLGIVGNISFVVGSLLFMSNSKHAAGLLFITGSSGMLVGNIGSAVVEFEEPRNGKRRY